MTEALQCAAREGKADTVKALLAARDTDVNADEQGNTALIEAARCGHDDVARAPPAAGASTKARDRSGKTALMLAVEGGRDEAVRAPKRAGPPNKMTALLVRDSRASTRVARVVLTDEGRQS